ncbi:MAG: DNA polymerase domain-containing protein, partial [Opitutales bacterium]
AWKTAMADKDGPRRDTIKPLEHQWLLDQRARLFRGLPLDRLRRLTIAIATNAGEDEAGPDPMEKADRVIAIGLLWNDPAAENALTVEILELPEANDQIERQMLKDFAARLQTIDPDIIEGHNVFGHALDYLQRRCRRFKVTSPVWGRFGQKGAYRRSRLRVAERWIDYPRATLPGRAVFDTLLMVQLYDLAARELPDYTLPEVAAHLNLGDSTERPFLTVAELATAFEGDRAAFRKQLEQDLREARALTDLLLPTYAAQCLNLPMTLQEVCLRGTGAKVESLLIERYLAAGAALPDPPEVETYEGAFTKSFRTGVFKHVLHYDVASLYPSLLLSINRNPAGDPLGAFLPLLTELREERLRYKTAAREADDPTIAREYNARQASYKILINSFYGYLGFAGARFGDSELAAEVTLRGRELLQELIERFEAENAPVLEADTDGLYVASPTPDTDPEALLAKITRDLPAGITLEFDGAYQAMFCYKAKNYALFDGENVTIRGSALRSRGIEPFLKALTDHLIRYQLGATEIPPETRIREYEAALEAGTLPVAQLAKNEYLSQRPSAYAKAVESGGKPRRASLEVALRMQPHPRQGEAVRYFITPGEKKRSPDWQVARPLSAYDPNTTPYDPAYYLRKLKEWRKRYAEFLS